ncbi:low temperature requirement protein A [Agromyces mariniharenae]|uniref:Low temperature requirement protein A n=2 Tax=Agromyces mariniharenae TaxID=2604423 RepID=A0A5S4VHQ3_9MICO|nr:low temperature requirement protein A [Agromyces mariniharenae]
MPGMSSPARARRSRAAGRSGRGSKVTTSTSRPASRTNARERCSRAEVMPPNGSGTPHVTANCRPSGSDGSATVATCRCLSEVPPAIPPTLATPDATHREPVAPLPPVPSCGMPFGLRRDVLRPTGTPRADRVTYVELFFDLVYVFALTQLSAYLYEHQDPLGAVEGAIMVVALWWSWVATTWVTNWLDPVKLPVRGAVIALALVAMVMSISIADAFGERAWMFAIAYVVLQLGRTGFIVYATWRHDRHAALDFARVLAWTAAGSVLWIVGALLPLPAQLPLWAMALGLEVLGALLGFPLPMMGPMDMGRWDLSGAHIAERSALFVLIALGEGLLVTGFSFVELDVTFASATAMLLAFASAAAMWWIYFDHGERIGAEAMEDSDSPGRLARTAYTFVHLLVIGGVVLVSVGDKELLGHPDEQSASAVVTVLGGPLLFLAGTLLFRRLLERRWPTAQVAGVLGIVAIAAFSPFLTPLAVGAVSTGVLVVVAAMETVDRLRRGRRAGG